MSTVTGKARTEVRLVAWMTDDDQVEVRMWAYPQKPLRGDFMQLTTAAVLALANKLVLATGMGPARDVSDQVAGAGESITFDDY